MIVVTGTTGVSCSMSARCIAVGCWHLTVDLLSSRSWHVILHPRLLLMAVDTATVAVDEARISLFVRVWHVLSVPGWRHRRWSSTRVTTRLRILTVSWHAHHVDVARTIHRRTLHHLHGVGHAPPGGHPGVRAAVLRVVMLLEGCVPARVTNTRGQSIRKWDCASTQGEDIGKHMAGE